MGSNPINLGFRFLLELAALVIYGYWGWNASDSALRYLLVLALPLIAAILWGTFAVLDDPSRSGKAPIPVSGFLRLILELVFFALAAYALFSSGKENLAWIFAGAVLVHYLLSYDRIIWLLQQKANPG
jgi:hypothetical protein